MSHHHLQSRISKHGDLSWLAYPAGVRWSGLGHGVAIEQMTLSTAESVVEAIRSADYDVDELLEEFGAYGGTFTGVLHSPTSLLNEQVTLDARVPHPSNVPSCIRLGRVDPPPTLHVQARSD